MVELTAKELVIHTPLFPSMRSVDRAGWGWQTKRIVEGESWPDDSSYWVQFADQRIYMVIKQPLTLIMMHN
jgi:hypothetical protein